MKYLYPTLFLAAFTAGACDRKSDFDLPKAVSHQASKDSSAWRDALASQAAQRRAEFMARAGHDKAVLNARISALKRAAASANTYAMGDLDVQIAQLEREQKNADQTFEAMRLLEGEKLQDLKFSMNESMARMKGSLEKIPTEGSD